MLSSSDVHNYLLGLGVAHEILHLPARSSTVARAAAQLGVPESDVVKSLVFLVDGAPHLVLCPGAPRRGHRAACRRLGAERAASREGHRRCCETTGYRVGAVPPCALAQDIPASPTRMRSPSRRLLWRRRHDDDAQDPRGRPAGGRAAGGRRSRRDGPGERASTSDPSRPDEQGTVTMTSQGHKVGTAGPATIFTDDDLRRLDEAALEVLAEVGVAIPSERARAASSRRGRPRTKSARRMRPSSCVAWRPGAAAVHAGRRAAAPLETGDRSLITTDGCCVEIFDFESGGKRGRRRRTSRRSRASSTRCPRSTSAGPR